MVDDPIRIEVVATDVRWLKENQDKHALAVNDNFDKVFIQLGKINSRLDRSFGAQRAYKTAVVLAAAVGGVAAKVYAAIAAGIGH